MSAFEGFLYIGGVLMPTPDSCDFTEYDLDSDASGRPESGVLFRERVRADLGKIPLSFTDLTVEQAQTLRDAVHPASFEVRIWFLGDYVTKTYYASDRHYKEKITPKNDGTFVERVDMDFELIEC